MKKQTFIGVFALLSLAINAQYAHLPAPFDTQHADVTTADIDADGDLDIIVSGTNGATNHAIFLNDGNASFTKQASADIIIPGHFADIKFGDINRDGVLDVVFNGNDNGASGIGVGINTGGGVFVNSGFPLINATISCGFGDFNNDGLQDVYLFGNGLGNSAIYFQTNAGSFNLDQSSFASYNIIDADVTVIDFNNDKNLDIFVSGWDDVAKSRISKLFLNNGLGAFTPSSQPNIIQKGFGSSVWGDVDGDGWLDLLLNGDGGANGEGSSDIYRLYKNSNGVLEAKATFNDYRQISVGDGARMVDWDNDGDLDVILTGWSGTKGRQATMLFECTNATNFTYTENALSNTDFPGVSESSIETSDLNNDGKIDLLITGYNGDQASQVGKYNRNIAGYYLNQTAIANTPPTAPTNLTMVSNGNDVTFSWDAATDAQTPSNGLSYNLSLYNATLNQWFIYPMANITTGYRQVAQLGNVCMNKSWTIKGLPDNSYQWTVQAIDANFTGGQFATPKTFSISGGITTDTKEVSTKSKIYSINNSLRIELPVLRNAHFEIFNLAGAKMIEGNLVSTSFETTLTQGFYLVKVVNGKDTIVQKVIIR